MKAVIYEKPGIYRVDDSPMPRIKSPSTVLLKVLAASIPAYTNEVLSGQRGFDVGENSIPGAMAIAEVVELAPNVVNLALGDRVYTDPWYRVNGPEDDDGILIGWTTLGSDQSKAHQALYRHGTFAEFCVWPAENLTKISPSLSSISSEAFIPVSFLSVAHGGLLAGSFQPGQVLIVNGASGNLGGCGVVAALAMGASKVVAVGRNLQSLNAVKETDPRRVIVVQLTGNLQNDSRNILEAAGGQGADLLLDLLGSVPSADATMAGIQSVRPKGTVVLMGGVQAQLPIDYSFIMLRQITIKGNFMYPKQTPTALFNLIAGGILDVKRFKVNTFVGLENFDKAVEAASKEYGGLTACAIVP